MFLVIFCQTQGAIDTARSENARVSSGRVPGPIEGSLLRKIVGTAKDGSGGVDSKTKARNEKGGVMIDRMTFPDGVVVEQAKRWVTEATTRLSYMAIECSCVVQQCGSARWFSSR